MAISVATGYPMPDSGMAQVLARSELGHKGLTEAQQQMALDALDVLPQDEAVRVLADLYERAERVRLIRSLVADAALAKARRK